MKKKSQFHSERGAKRFGPQQQRLLQKNVSLTISPELASAFSQALTLHQVGRLAEAEKNYLQILTAQPKHFDSLHLLGVIYHQRGNYAEAVHQFDVALKINPKAAAAHSNRGNALKELKRLDEALASYDKAIALKPDHAAAFNNRGNALKALKRIDEALASYDKAIALKSDYAEAFNNRGAALQELKRLDEALASYDKATALKPDYAEAFNNRGAVLQELKRFDEALASYDKAITLKPDYADAFNNRGAALQELKRFDEALASYDKAITLKPDYATALNNRGAALKELKRLDEALASYDKATALKPDYAEAFNNRGNALQELKRLDEALASYDKAIALKPDYAEAFNNRGIASLEKLLKSGRQRAADLLCREQTRQGPFVFHAHYDKRPRVLRLTANDLATTYLDAKSNKPRVHVEGHWESDHFLLDTEVGAITGHLFNDTDPQSIVDFIRKTDREIIVNCIADPDLYSKTLSVAEEVVRLARLPVINPPSLIQLHTRDAIARRLQGIPGLRVPQTIRLTARPGLSNPLQFPFIARECGTQTGATMELINDRAKFDSFLQRHDERQLYLTEFTDFRSSDGLYRKYRVRIVGDELFPNHLFVNTHWKVHGHSSREFMLGGPAYLAEERAFFSEPFVHLDILREIHKRVGVDFYGIDYSVLSSGSLVYFEANASMRSIYPEWRESFPETWAITQQLVDRFTHHLKSRMRPSDHDVEHVEDPIGQPN
jgi:tetratricopeptide (TPR) repeat protein